MAEEKGRVRTSAGRWDLAPDEGELSKLGWARGERVKGRAAEEGEREEERMGGEKRRKSSLEDGRRDGESGVEVRWDQIEQLMWSDRQQPRAKLPREES